MKIYTLIGGVNGVGKSSLSGVLTAEKSDLGTIVDPDKITAAGGGDKLKGGKASVTLINQCLEKGVNFTQESTLSGTLVLRTMRKARKLGYYIRLYYVGVNTSDESLERIRNRVRKGGHDIPEDDVLRRFAKRFDDVAKVLPYCDEARFFDNDNGFTEIGTYRRRDSDDITVTAADVPPWFSQLISFLKKQEGSA